MSQTRAYAGISADERRAERRQRLIRAAVTLYGRDGYAAVGVRAICWEAGLTERYFYEAFPNGEALLIASLRAVAGIVFETLETAALEGRTVEEKVNLALAAFYALIRSHPAEARLFLRGMDGVSATVDAARIAVLLDFVRFYDRITLRPHADGLLSAGIIGGVLQIALAWIHLGFRQPEPEVVADAARLCLAILPQDVLAR